MGEQDESRSVSTGATEPPMVPDQPFDLKLPSAVQAIAWSTVAAVITWLATCLGQTYFVGRYAALGLNALSPPPIDQRHILFGIDRFLQCAIDAIVGAVLVVGFLVVIVYLPLLWKSLKTRGVGQLDFRFARRVARRHHFRFARRVTKNLCWIAPLLAFLVFVEAGVAINYMKRLQECGRGVLLSTSEGSTWTKIVREQNGALNIAYGGALALFIGPSWWLIAKGFNRRPGSTIAFSLCVIAATISFLFDYAYLSGMADAVQKFPVVTYSGMTRSGRDIFFLLGEDDKMFALLDRDLDEKKYVIYLPRTEVKWMTVIQYSPIYSLDKNALMRLAEQVKNSSH